MYRSVFLEEYFYGKTFCFFFFPREIKLNFIEKQTPKFEGGGEGKEKVFHIFN